MSLGEKGKQNQGIINEIFAIEDNEIRLQEERDDAGCCAAQFADLEHKFSLLSRHNSLDYVKKLFLSSLAVLQNEKPETKIDCASSDSDAKNIGGKSNPTDKSKIDDLLNKYWNFVKSGLQIKLDVDADPVDQSEKDILDEERDREFMDAIRRKKRFGSSAIRAKGDISNIPQDFVATWVGIERLEVCEEKENLIHKFKELIGAKNVSEIRSFFARGISVGFSGEVFLRLCSDLSSADKLSEMEPSIFRIVSENLLESSEAGLEVGAELSAEIASETQVQSMVGALHSVQVGAIHNVGIAEECEAISEIVSSDDIDADLPMICMECEGFCTALHFTTERSVLNQHRMWADFGSNPLYCIPEIASLDPMFLGIFAPHDKCMAQDMIIGACSFRPSTKFRGIGIPMGRVHNSKNFSVVKFSNEAKSKSAWFLSKPILDGLAIDGSLVEAYYRGVKSTFSDVRSRQWGDSENSFYYDTYTKKWERISKILKTRLMDAIRDNVRTGNKLATDFIPDEEVKIVESNAKAVAAIFGEIADAVLESPYEEGISKMLEDFISLIRPISCQSFWHIDRKNGNTPCNIAFARIVDPMMLNILESVIDSIRSVEDDKDEYVACFAHFLLRQDVSVTNEIDFCAAVRSAIGITNLIRANDRLSSWKFVFDSIVKIDENSDDKGGFNNTNHIYAIDPVSTELIVRRILRDRSSAGSFRVSARDRFGVCQINGASPRSFVRYMSASQNSVINESMLLSSKKEIIGHSPEAKRGMNLSSVNYLLSSDKSPSDPLVTAEELINYKFYLPQAMWTAGYEKEYKKDTNSKGGTNATWNQMILDAKETADRRSFQLFAGSGVYYEYGSNISPKAPEFHALRLLAGVRRHENDGDKNSHKSTVGDIANNYCGILRKAELDNLGKSFESVTSEYREDTYSSWTCESNASCLGITPEEFEAQHPIDRINLLALSSTTVWRLIGIGDRLKDIVDAAVRTNYSPYIAMRKAMLLRYLGLQDNASENGINLSCDFLDRVLTRSLIADVVGRSKPDALSDDQFLTRCNSIIGLYESVITSAIIIFGSVQLLIRDDVENVAKAIDVLRNALIMSDNCSVNLKYLSKTIMQYARIGSFETIGQFAEFIESIGRIFSESNDRSNEILKETLDSIVGDGKKMKAGYQAAMQHQINSSSGLPVFIAAGDVSEAPSGYVGSDKLLLRAREIRDRITSMAHLLGIVNACKVGLISADQRLIAEKSRLCLDAAMRIERVALLRSEIAECKDDLQRMMPIFQDARVEADLSSISDPDDSCNMATLMNVGLSFIEAMTDFSRSSVLYARLVRSIKSSKNDYAACAIIMPFISLSERFVRMIHNGLFSPIAVSNDPEKNAKLAFDAFVNTVGIAIDVIGATKLDAEIILSVFKEALKFYREWRIIAIFYGDVIGNSLDELLARDLASNHSAWDVNMAHGISEEAFSHTFANFMDKYMQRIESLELKDVIDRYSRTMNSKFSFQVNSSRAILMDFIKSVRGLFVHVFNATDKTKEWMNLAIAKDFSLTHAATAFFQGIAALDDLLDKIDGFESKEFCESLSMAMNGARLDLIRKCCESPGTIAVMSSTFDAAMNKIRSKELQLENELQELNTLSVPLINLLDGVENNGFIDEDIEASKLMNTADGSRFFNSLKAYGTVINGVPLATAPSRKSEICNFGENQTLLHALRSEVGSLVMKYKIAKSYHNVRSGSDVIGLDIKAANFRSADSQDRETSDKIKGMMIADMGIALARSEIESRSVFYEDKKVAIKNRIDASILGCTLSEDLLSAAQNDLESRMRPDYSQIVGHIFGSLIRSEGRIVINVMPTGSGKTSIALPLRSIEEISRGNTIVVLTHDKKSSDEIANNNILRRAAGMAYRVRTGEEQPEDRNLLRSLTETEAKTNGGVDTLIACTQPNEFLYYITRREMMGLPTEKDRFLFCDEADQAFLDKDSSGNFRQTKPGKISSSIIESQDFFSVVIDRMLCLIRNNLDCSTKSSIVNSLIKYFKPKNSLGSVAFKEEMLRKIADYAFEGFDINDDDKLAFAGELIIALSMNHGDDFAPVRQGGAIKVLCLDQNSGEFLSSSTRFVGVLTHKVLEARIGASIGRRDITVSSCSYVDSFAKYSCVGVTATPPSRVEMFLTNKAIEAVKMVDKERILSCEFAIVSVPPTMPNNRIEFVEPNVVDASMIFDGKVGLPALINQLLGNELTTIQISVENSEKASGLTFRLKEWAESQCASGIDLVRPNEISTINAEKEANRAIDPTYDPASIIDRVGKPRDDENAAGIKILVTDQTGHRAQDIRAPHHVQILFFEGSVQDKSEKKSDKDLVFDCGNCDVVLKTRHTDRTLVQCIGRAGRRGKFGQVHYFYAVNGLASKRASGNIDDSKLRVSARDALIKRGVNTEIDSRTRAYKNILSGTFGKSNDHFLHSAMFDHWINQAFGIVNQKNANLIVMVECLIFAIRYADASNILLIGDRAKSIMRDLIISYNNEIMQDQIDDLMNFNGNKEEKFKTIREYFRYIDDSKILVENVQDRIRQLLFAIYADGFSECMDMLHSCFTSESDFWKFPFAKKEAKINTLIENIKSKFNAIAIDIGQIDKDKVSQSFTENCAIFEIHRRKLIDMTSRVEEADKHWGNSVDAVLGDPKVSNNVVAMKADNDNNKRPNSKLRRFSEKKDSVRKALGCVGVVMGSSFILLSASMIIAYNCDAKFAAKVVEQFGNMDLKMRINSGDSLLILSIVSSIIAVSLVVVGSVMIHLERQSEKNAMPRSEIIAPWRIGNLADDENKLLSLAEYLQ